jgi:hypothetical protein
VKNGRLILSKAYAENIPLTLVVDTGAQISIGNMQLREKLSRGGRVKRNAQVELQSVTGEKIMGEYTIVREIEVGGIKLKNMPIVFADSHAFRRLNLDSKPALPAQEAEGAAAGDRRSPDEGDRTALTNATGGRVRASLFGPIVLRGCGKCRNPLPVRVADIHRARWRRGICSPRTSCSTTS